jgi:hypothetical protein
MGLTNFPNGVSSFGMPVLGSGGIMTTGNVFFVDSGAAKGKDSADRGSSETPFLTLDYAVGRCTANNGDVIFVMPGHAENLAADSAVDIDVAGITVVGLGSGAARPTFTFITAVTADFKLAAASTRIYNLLFKGGIDALTGPIEVTGADCLLKDCEWQDSTGQATDVIVTVADADRLTIDGWRHIGAAAAGGASAIALIGADDCTLTNCEIYGNFSVSAIDFRTTLSARARIHDCQIWTENAADLCIKDTVTASTGVMGPNIMMVLQDNAANITEAITGPTFFLNVIGVHVVNNDDEASIALNWTAATDA